MLFSRRLVEQQRACEGLACLFLVSSSLSLSLSLSVLLILQGHPVCLDQSPDTESICLYYCELANYLFFYWLLDTL